MFTIASIEDLCHYAHVGLKGLTGKPRSIVLEFQGLNRYEFFVQPSCELELELASENILYVIPYTAPWSWMNECAVAYTNRLLDEIFRLFDLPQETPIVATGYSMGGLAALMYPVFASRPISASMANSPVCDLVGHYYERGDVPRTLANAFITYPDGIAAGIESRSPLHQLDKMKKIPYFIVAGDRDTEVLVERHCVKMIAAMRERGMRVIYHQLPTMHHWQIDDYSVLRAAVSFVKGGWKAVE